MILSAIGLLVVMLLGAWLWERFVVPALDRELALLEGRAELRWLAPDERGVPFLKEAEPS